MEGMEINVHVPYNLRVMSPMEECLGVQGVASRQIGHILLSNGRLESNLGDG
jgi:hypothetical protein